MRRVCWPKLRTRHLLSEIYLPVIYRPIVGQKAIVPNRQNAVQNIEARRDFIEGFIELNYFEF